MCLLLQYVKGNKPIHPNVEIFNLSKTKLLENLVVEMLSFFLMSKAENLKMQQHQQIDTYENKLRQCD